MNFNNLLFTSIVIIIFGTITAIVLKLQIYLTSKGTVEDDIEVENRMKNFNKHFSEESKDDEIFKIMYQNLSELREYYTISKQQATRSYASAKFFCSVGFTILLMGIVFFLFKNNQEIAIFSIVASVINESIAALFFWLYRKSINQLNLYYQGLRQTEHYLMSINITNKISDENRDHMLIEIIRTLMGNTISCCMNKDQEG